MEASDILYKNESFRIIGAAMEVHKVLGCGFVEVVYQEALEEEFKKRNIPYERGKELKINYKDKLLSKTFRADFICYDNIILELKAVHEFTDDHYAQNIFIPKGQQHATRNTDKLWKSQPRLLPTASLSQMV